MGVRHECPANNVMGDFNSAAETVKNKLNKTLSDDELKQVYGLFKQATVGDVNLPKPGMTDLRGAAKWEAWKAVEGLSKDQAQQQYVELTAKLVEKHGVA